MYTYTYMNMQHTYTHNYTGINHTAVIFKLVTHKTAPNTSPLSLCMANKRPLRAPTPTQEATRLHPHVHSFSHTQQYSTVTIAGQSPTKPKYSH